eukprot:jgi/Picre1/30042/NNA_005414.t1
MTRKDSEKEIFVNGRLCLLGEHSDWSGSFRRMYIVAGINYGLYARAYRLDEPVLRVRSTKDTGEVEECEYPMDENVLIESAKRGGFWSYAAGVAYVIATEFE